jgi:hypothetical protein
MRLLTIIFTWTILVSCSAKKQTNTDNDFKRYLNSLELLETPVSFDAKRGIKVRSQNYDTGLFKKFKYNGSVGPQGKIFDRDSVVMIVEILAGDFVIPLLTTFDQEGRPLDTLNPYDKSGVDMGYECYEFVTVTDKKEIIVTDSTRRWNFNSDTTNIIEGTAKLTVDTVIYKVDKKGKFIKTRG